MFTINTNPACSGGKHVYVLIGFYVKTRSETSSRHHSAWQYLVSPWSTFSFLRFPIAPLLFSLLTQFIKEKQLTFLLPHLPS